MTTALAVDRYTRLMQADAIMRVTVTEIGYDNVELQHRRQHQYKITLHNNGVGAGDSIWRPAICASQSAASGDEKWVATLTAVFNQLK